MSQYLYFFLKLLFCNRIFKLFGSLAFNLETQYAMQIFKNMTEHAGFFPNYFIKVEKVLDTI